MTITIETHKFTTAHGRLPRGYGLWMFGFWPAFKYDPYNEPAEKYSFTGKYSDAVKSARAYAVAKGFSLVEVLP